MWNDSLTKQHAWLDYSVDFHIGCNSTYKVIKTTFYKNELFNASIAQAILSIPNPVLHKAEKLCWVLESKGDFFVKLAYRALLPPTTHSTSLNVNWNKLWKLKAPQRTKMFMWRLKCNILPTKDNLSCLLGTSKTCCVLYNNKVESPPHLFFNCHHAKALWFAAYQGFKVDSNCPSTWSSTPLKPNAPLKISGLYLLTWHSP